MRSAPFSGLAESLLRGGVAPGQVRRTVAELEAHLRDLIGELRVRGLSPEQAELEARARLGSDEALVASVLARPELRSWVQRRPWAAFAIAPVFSFMVLFAVSVAAFVLVIQGLKSVFGVSLHIWMPVRTLTPMLITSVLWVLPGLAAAPYVWLAASRRIGAKWPMVGVVLIALLGATATMGMEWPTPSAQASVSAGLGFSTDHAIEPAARVGLTLTLALFPLALRRLRGVR